MRVNVSLMGDLCLPFPISMTAHDGIPPPAPVPIFPPATPLPCMESPTPIMWPPGLALQQNKLTTTVFHMAQFIALDGHDCGYMIPHVTIPPANLKLPVIIAFSSRKVMFSASTVKANGTAIGCASFFTMAAPTPMLCCAFPVSLPIGTPPLNALHTVTVGMTWADWFAGLIACVVTMVVDYLCNKVPFFSDNVLGDWASGLLGAGNFQQWALKAVAGVITGAAKIALTGEGNMQIGVGSGYAGAQGSVGVTQEGAVTAGGQVNAVVPGLPASVQGAYQHTFNPDGTSSDQVTGSVGTPVGVGTAQRTTEHDQAGNTTKTTTQTTASGGVVAPVGAAVAPAVPGAGLGTATGAGTYQSTTVQETGQAPTTTSGAYGGVGTPFGGWGSDL